jgi:hypothetical protein
VELDRKDRAALERFVEELHGLHGEALLAVVLTGEAAGPGYRPGRSALTTIAVLQDVTPEALRRTRERVAGWRRRRIPTPLLMDPLYIQSSLDVFPLEFLEIEARHEMLFGDRDPFAGLSLDFSNLRLEVEEQVRGKMLHLWEAYLETGASKRSLRRLLLETSPGFETILRGMLLLKGAGQEDDPEHPEAETPAAFLGRIEEGFGVELPVFRRLEAARRGEAELDRRELEETFEAYLNEVRQLVRLADSL